MRKDLIQSLSETMYRTTKDYSDADIFYRQIIDLITQKQQLLKKNEYMLIVAHLNDGEPIIVSGFGYKNPDMLIISSFDEFRDNNIVLCHKNSVQLSIRITEKEVKGAKKKFGFLPPADN